MISRLKSIIVILRARGFIGLLIALLVALQAKVGHKRRHKDAGVYFKFLAKIEDIENVDFSKNKTNYVTQGKKDKYIINWVISPPSESGGGHQNIYRFIKYLENAGHKCRIYLYASDEKISLEKVIENTSKNYDLVDAEINWIEDGMEPADAIFATGWETAYPVFNIQSNARKFYFIQDFEPCFYPMGSEYKLAEKTYSMDFHGLTAGPWLSSKLSKEYSMDCDFYNFGYDPKIYQFNKDSKRDKIFFYARPVTPRRGFELGLMSLELFHKQHPEIEIIMAGWDVSDYDIKFPYTNLKSVPIDELSEIYNSCIAGLVLSFSNVSLLPLELMSCGVVPVVNSGENNEMVIGNENVVYCGISPKEISDSLSRVISNPDRQIRAEKVASSVTSQSWDESSKQFLGAFKRVMNG